MNCVSKCTQHAQNGVPGSGCHIISLMLTSWISPYRISAMYKDWNECLVVYCITHTHPCCPHTHMDRHNRSVSPAGYVYISMAYWGSVEIIDVPTDVWQRCYGCTTLCMFACARVCSSVSSQTQLAICSTRTLQMLRLVVLCHGGFER